MFDYAQLVKHGIDIDSLPVGSQVIGKPITLLSKYKTEIILLLLTGLLLVGAILALLFLNRKKTKAERNLVKSNDKLLRILETANEGFLELNTKGLIINVNKELCTMLDTERDALINYNLADLLKQNSNEKDIEKFNNSFNGTAESFELKIKTRLNRTKDLVLNLSPLFATGTKTIQSIFGLVSDITYLKENEAQLILAKEKAENSDKLKSAFLANMSHEIRTPMNAILGFTDLLAEQGLSKDQRSYYVDIIQKSGNNLLNLINDILDLSKIEAGEIDIIINQVDVNKLMHNLLSTFKEHRKTLGKEFIKFKMNPLIDTLFINTDGFRLTQILNNLLNNAFKFTETGEIKFGCHPIDNNEIQFFVSDTGIGMPAEMQELIFERFHKIETLNNQVYRGAGLGLAISKNLVELLGGTIYCNSVKEKGTTFYFTIKGK
jgi:PAS domain S-box-containing protein